MFSETKENTMQIKFLIDKNGNVIGVKDLARREAKGWSGTFKTALKECGNSGKQFLRENEQGLAQFAKEIAGLKKK
jgi:hypothetical protein